MIEEPAETADVGRRFHLFFLYTFYLSAIGLASTVAVILVILLQMGYSATRNALSLMGLLSNLTGLLSFVLGIFVIISRFQPSGKLASGDGLPYEADHSQTVYYEGLFLWWVTLIAGIAIVIALFSACI